MQSSLPLVIGAKRFVHKHLLGDLNADQAGQQQPARQAAANGTPLIPDRRPPSGPAFPNSSSPTAPAARTMEAQDD
jgi:hypothetical protein